MARRTRSKTKTRTRRRSSGVNVVNAAESLVLANAASRMLFGTGIVQFATEGWLRPATPGASYGSGNSWTLSAAELVQGALGGGFGQSGKGGYTNDLAGIGLAMKTNLKANGVQSVATFIVAPIAFKMAKKVLRKPLLTPMNKALKMSGLNSVVKV